MPSGQWFRSRELRLAIEVWALILLKGSQFLCGILRISCFFEIHGYLAILHMLIIPSHRTDICIVFGWVQSFGTGSSEKLHLFWRLRLDISRKNWNWFSIFLNWPIKSRWSFLNSYFFISKEFLCLFQKVKTRLFSEQGLKWDQILRSVVWKCSFICQLIFKALSPLMQIFEVQ